MLTVLLAGHAVNEGITQPTITLNEQVDVFPLPSFAVAVTVVVPTGKNVPDSLVYVIVGTPQLSVAVTV